MYCRRKGENQTFHGKRDDLENNRHKYCIFSKIESMCNTVFQNIETKPSFSEYKLNTEEENSSHFTPFLFMVYIKLILKSFYFIVIAY